MNNDIVLLLLKLLFLHLNMSFRNEKHPPTSDQCNVPFGQTSSGISDLVGQRQSQLDMETRT